MQLRASDEFYWSSVLVAICPDEAYCQLAETPVSFHKFYNS